MSIQISSLEGNRQALDGGAMFGNVPRPLWSKWLAPDAAGRITLACRSMLIEADGLRILCEAGIGAFFSPALKERFGVEGQEHRLVQSLAQLGLRPEDIDVVILSHLHFDHAGGLLPTYEEIAAGRDQLVFSKARYVVGAEALERSTHPHARDRASFIPGLVEKLTATGRLSVVTGASLPDLLPTRLSFRYTHGHTPGQMHLLLHGATNSVFFAGDLIPGTPWVHLPITMGYDRFAEQVIDEKAALYQEAVAGGWQIFYTHDPEWAMSQIQQPGKSYEPAAKQASLQRWTL